MVKLLLVSSALLAGAACSLANTISGTFQWLQGTLVNSITPSQSAQTIQLKVGNTTYNLTNTYVPGISINGYGSGQPFVVMKSGSQPFAATYSSSGLVVFNGAVGPSPIERCSVPMNTSGSIVGNIGFGPNEYLQLLLPGCTVGTYSFPNGLTETIQAALPSFSLTSPTGTGSTCGTVTFPTGTASMNTFQFTGSGNGVLSMVGSSATKTVAVSGFTTGTATVFGQASLRILVAQVDTLH